jgi:hypothetical protein
VSDERLLAPQDLDAEEAVLGALLAAGVHGLPAAVATVEAVAAELQPGDFYRHSHALIFEAATTLVADGRPCDAILVAAELEQRGQLDEIGGKVRVHELAALVPAVSNASHYARRVRETAVRRALIREAGQISEAALNGAAPPDTLARLRRSVELLETSYSEPAWLERASDLLAEPDPGPTPFLVDDLIVEAALVQILGSWKVGKTWLILALTLAIATGKPLLGRLPVKQGPVILVVEESGREALHRRLDVLRRGYALDADALADVHFAANRRVRLNDPGWQRRLLAAGRRVQPRVIFLDPLARLKGAQVDENVQREIGPVLDFMRDLRDDSAASVAYSHHSGHQGTHARGSSDLEAYWESRLGLSREDGVCELQAEHREAEGSPTIHYRLAFDVETRTMRLREEPDRAAELDEKVAAELEKDPGASANAVLDAMGGNRQDGLAAYKRVKERQERDHAD